MRTKLIVISLLLITGLMNIINAQQPKAAGPFDTLVIVWSSGEPEVAEKSCLMYAHAAK